MKTQNSKTAATITAETGGENQNSTALTHSFSASQARSARAFRRSLFIPGLPEINTAAIRNAFGMGIEYLAAASFPTNEKMFGDGIIRDGIEMKLIKPQEKLLVTVYVCRTVKAGEPETYNTRVVHCANRIDEGEDDENAEYETTQVYLADGVMSEDAKAIFVAEHAGLQKYACEHLKKGDEFSPFCHWQYVC